VKGSTLRCLALVIAMVAAAAQAQAQSPPSTPASSPPGESAAPAPTETPAPAKPTGPSAETLKKAKNLGMHPEIHNGTTMYCWEDESIGSRFKTKKCTDEAGLDAVISSRQAMKDQMKNGSGTSNH
jgi:hypothetical protein